METVKINDKGRTKFIAHRGLGGIELENTLCAFVAAGNRPSYYGVECDIHVTTDGRFVVFHDDTSGRLCATDVRMETSDFETIRALKFKGGDAHVVPTLEEYLSVMARYNKTAVVEIKNRMKESDIRKVVEICKANYSLDMITFISFDFDNLVDVRKLLPTQSVQFLTAEFPDGIIDRLAAHGFDIDMGHWLATEERVKALHDNGVAVNCWTCDDPADAARLISYGVDFITTNILE